jgi:hypothetical protein
MTGEKFLHGLMTPIEPRNIFFMLQTGYAADFILALTVDSLNGVRNRSVNAGAVREADPEFKRALQLLREVQASGAFGMRVEEDKAKAKGSTAVLFFRGQDVPADIMEKVSEIRRLLKLPTDQQRYLLTYSPVRGADNELAVNSRSMLQILSAFASYVEVPEAHLKEHRAVPISENTPSETRQDVARIHSGKEKPADAYAAVLYRGYWFWVEDGDWQTKRALTAVMFFFTLMGAGGAENLPLVTIPAQ